MEKLILYARKSTDTEDKQVLSIEAQLTELRKYARDNHLLVIDELVEKRTAKMPGRPVFNSLLTRIKNGEATGILAWHPDRLARNSASCASIDRTCLSSVSVLLRAYKISFSIYLLISKSRFDLRIIQYNNQTTSKRLFEPK